MASIWAILLAGLAFALAGPTPPVLAATITVDTTTDEDTSNASCSLREAIKAANTDAAYNGCMAGSGADTIAFNLTGTALSVRTTTLSNALGALPAITTLVTIDGWSQGVNDGTATPVACSPRPAVALTARPTGDGRLQVTLTADTQGANTANRLTALQIPPGTNAVLDIGGKTGQTGPLMVPLPDRPTSVTFFVRRANPGQAVTQPIVAVDGRGAWPTFVGGGPDAW